MSYSGPPNPSTLFVAEAWGADEDIAKLPLVGVSGQEHFRMMGEAYRSHPSLHTYALELCSPQWGLAWVRRRNDWLSACSIGLTNVFNFRPANNNLETICAPKDEVGGKNYPFSPLTRSKTGRQFYLHPDHFSSLRELHSRVEACRPNLVVCLGATALWAFTNSTGITAVRGTTQLTSPTAPINHQADQPFLGKILPTFHPASLLYEGQWSRRPTIIADYMKAARESAFPEIRRPNRSIIISPTLQEVINWIEQTLNHPPPFLTVDEETSLGLIDTIGFAINEREALVIPFGPHRYKRGDNYFVIWPYRDGQRTPSYWTFEEERIVWQLVCRLLSSPIPKVYQNGLYDLQYSERIGVVVNNPLHDTMLAWSALYSESPKSLGYLGSILTDESAWKQLARHRSDTEKRDE